MHIKSSQPSLFHRKLISLVGAFIVAISPVIGQAEEFTVNTDQDVANASSGAPVCGEPCSLRAAIIAANNRYGPDIINLGNHNPFLHLAGDGENSAITGDLDITDGLTIIGKRNDGQRNSITGNTLGDRVFHIIGNADVIIQNVLILGGRIAEGPGGGIFVDDTARVELDNVELRSNEVTASKTTFETSGGGIYVAQGATALVKNSIITLNRAPAGGGASNTGRLEVRNTEITENKATRNLNGGGISNLGGYLTIGNSVLSDNDSTQSGGALYAANLGENLGSVVITNTQFDGNSAAAQGGAIANLSPPLAISNSSFTRNNSTFDGGGIYNSGIGSVDITNSTISENYARSGGGIFNTRQINLTNSTLHNNVASPCTIACDGGPNGNGQIGGNQLALFTATTSSKPNATLSNTIITDGLSSNPNTRPCAGNTNYLSYITTIGHNMENDSSCGLVSNNPFLDQPNVPIIELGVLGMELDPDSLDEIYPGTTEVIPLLPSSPAVDNGSNSSCPLVDQRFLVRDDKCDVGAYEFGATEQHIGGLVDLKVSLLDTPDPVAPNNEHQPLNYVISVANLYVDDSAENVTVRIQLPSSYWYNTLTFESTSASPTCGNPDSTNTIICEVSSIPGLGRVDFFISGYPTSEGVITLIVDVWSATVDAFEQNNTNIQEETTVSQSAGATDNFNPTSSGRGGGTIDLLLLALISLGLISRRYGKLKR